MIAPSRTIAAVLAAGRSKRFGGDKLLHVFDSRPLGAHIAVTLADLPLLQRIAICPPDAPARSQIYSARGFIVLDNPQPDRGMGSSLALAAQHAAAMGADALLVCLADMPHVPATHLLGLLAQASLDRNAATVVDQLRCPPVAFGAQSLPDLTRLSGDRGAWRLLAAATLVPVAADTVRDYDLPADFSANQGAADGPSW